MWSRNRLLLDGFGKAGMYGNAASGNVTSAVANNSNPPVITAFSAQSGQVSFVSEIGLVATYSLTDHLSLRGGYQVLWVTGLALLSDNFDPAAINLVTGGNAFFHGATAGAEFKW